MKHTRLLPVAAALLAACSAPIPLDPPAPAPVSSAPPVDSAPVSAATSIDGYKRELAERISRLSMHKVYESRPQALLRSVIVLRYTIDAHGRLVRTDIQRSNKDREAESTALASLHSAAPFPKPPAHLLRRGQLEVSETWLFNNDGRFQLRSIALPQMDR